MKRTIVINGLCLFMLLSAGWALRAAQQQQKKSIRRPRHRCVSNRRKKATRPVKPSRRRKPCWRRSTMRAAPKSVSLSTANRKANGRIFRAGFFNGNFSPVMRGLEGEKISAKETFGCKSPLADCCIAIGVGRHIAARVCAPTTHHARRARCHSASGGDEFARSAERTRTGIWTRGQPSPRNLVAKLADAVQ